MSEDYPQTFRGQQIPESVRARLMAAQLLQQAGMQAQQPYTSKGVTAARALTSFLGGMQERQAIQGEEAAQAAHRSALAQILMGGASPGATTAAAAAPPASAAPASYGGGGVGSDRVASKSHEDFIASMMPEAQRISAQTGIDPRLIVAQAAHESNFGRSAPGGNLFGIKGAGTGPISTMESVNGVMTPTKASFATYDSPSASFDGYGKLMSSPRYAGVRNGGDLDSQLAALGKSGYATDPNYAARVGAIARGIQLPGAGQGTTTASADMPAPNAQPVASTTLPPGVTPDMLGPGAQPSPYGAMPTSMAQAPAVPDAATLAAALRGQAGGSGPGASPVPATAQPSSPFGAMPQGMDQASASIPAPSMMGAPPPPLQPSPFGAGPQPMQGQPGPDQRALAAALLARTKPQAPAPSPMADPSQDPAGLLSANGLQMAGMGANGSAGLAGAPAATPPVAASGLSSDQLPGMDNFGSDGSVRQASTGADGFTGSFGPGIAPSINGDLPAMQAAAGGPAPQPDPSTPGPMSPPPAIMAQALRQGGANPTPPMVLPSPQSAGPLPAPIPTLPPGQVNVDQNAGPAPVAVLGATPDGSPPSIADTATAAMAKAGYDTSGLPGAVPPGVNAATLGPAAQAGIAKNAAASPVPMLAGANVSAPDLSGLGGSTTPPPPGAALPIMATQAANPPGVLLAALRARGAGSDPARRSTNDGALPDTGPLPPVRPSDVALGLNPDAPAPGAVAAGPARLTNPMARALAVSPQPLGLTGDGGADPSSARSFLTQQAQGQAGGPSPSMMASVLRGNSPATASTSAPAAAQQGGDDPISAMGRMFGGGGGGGGPSPGQGQAGGGLGGLLSGLPIIGDIFGGGQSNAGQTFGGRAAPASYSGGQGAPFTPGGQGAQPGAAGAGQGQATPTVAGMSQSQVAAILSDPRTTPAEMQFLMSRISPTPEKLSAGEGLVGRRPDGTYGSLYSQPNKPDWQDLGNGYAIDKNDPQGRAIPIPGGRAPVKLGPGDQLIGPNGTVAAVPATPHYEPVPGTGQAIDTTTARPAALPAGAGSTFQTLKVGGVDVPVRITPDPAGGQPKVELMTPGGAGAAPAGQSGGPISFNAPAGGAAAQSGPLGGIAPLVQQAGQMEAANAAAKEGAVDQVKGANTFVETHAKQGSEASNHVQEMQQLKALGANAPTGWSADLARYTSSHGWVNANGDAVQSYDGLRSYLGTQLRQAGSGALRNSEMDKLSDALGSTNMTPATRAAAVQRIQDGYARQAALGQVASDQSVPDPMAKQARIQDVQQTWMNADAAIEAHPDKRAAIISKMQAAGYPVVGF